MAAYAESGGPSEKLVHAVVRHPELPRSDLWLNSMGLFIATLPRSAGEAAKVLAAHDAELSSTVVSSRRCSRHVCAYESTLSGSSATWSRQHKTDSPSKGRAKRCTVIHRMTRRRIHADQPHTVGRGHIMTSPSPQPHLRPPHPPSRNTARSPPQ